MPDSISNQRVRSLAGAQAVSRLISHDFGFGNGELPKIHPELVREVIAIAKANKVLKPVLSGLDSLEIALPDESKAGVASYFRKATRNNAAALATLAEVSKKLSDEGIVHAAFKGPVRQIALRQDVFERPVADVDILVRHTDFQRATDLLKEMGYWIPLFCDSRWWRHYLGEHPLLPIGGNRIGVDLHHRTQHPSCPRPRYEDRIFDDLAWTELGRLKVPMFGPISIFLNTVMSIVKGLANREPTGSHALDLARQLHAADENRLAEYERAARDQGLVKSYLVARRAALVMTGVAPVPTGTWFVPDEDLLAMLLTPEDPDIRWPRHTKLLWKLVDGKNRLGRAVKFSREFAWWAAAEFSRRTHDVSQLPARADPRPAEATAA